MAPCKLNSCCFCLELKVGCIVIGVVGIILSIIGVALVAYWESILVLILSFIANGCLVVAAIWQAGTIQVRSILLIVYIIFEIINVVIAFIGAILFFVAVGATSSNFDSYSTALIATAGVIYVIQVALAIYFIIVVVSYLQELKSGGGGSGNSAQPA